MAGTVSRMAQLALQNAAARFRERYIDPRALRAARARAKPSALRVKLEPDPFGHADVGLRLIDGRFDLAGVDRECAARLMWRAEPPSLGWAEQAHRFDWLSDLAAVGDERAHAAALSAVQGWLAAFEAYDALAWRPDLAGRRLRNWLIHAPLIAPPPEPRGEKGEAAGKALLLGLATHAEWLRDHWAFCDPGPDRTIAAGALVTFALASRDREDDLPGALERLQSALSESLDADGGSVTRAPSDAFEILALLTGLMRDFAAANESAPAFIEEAALRVARMARFFRDVDGGLVGFHGGRAYGDGRLDATQAELGAYDPAPTEAPAAGYLRMREGRTLVMMDVGAAPDGPAARTVHASALALTLSVGRRRVIVNCGPGRHLDAEWAASLRNSAAQSTFILDGQSSARPVLAGRRGGRGLGLGRGVQDEALVGPSELVSERKEEANGVWILGAHDGYVATHGLSLTRRMFLSADGGDFRGEDRLEIEPSGAAAFKRRMNRLRGPEKALGVPFTARFHLHPDVSAELIAEGEAVTLRLPSEEAWVMRHSGGRLALEPSVYIDEAGGPRSTRQIVITGGVTERSTRVRWAFRRVGELSQIGLDVAALLEAVSEAEDDVDAATAAV